MKEKLQQVLNLLSEGKNSEQISLIIFKTKSNIQFNRFCSENNINLKQYKAFKYMDKEWLSEQLKKYKNSPTILARELNLSLTSVNRYAIEFGLRKPKKSIASVNPINEKYFDEVDNFKKAYWLGFIMADGYTYKTPNREKYELAIKIKSTDIDHLKEFAEDIEFPEEKIVIGSGKRNGNINYYCSLRTYNTHLVTTVMNKHKIVQNKTYVQCLPDSIPEEDRIWYSLAAYNMGLGHILDARRLTKKLGGNPDNWLDVKNNLLLLSEKRHYSNLKYGYARGYEAYQYVENIRRYMNSIVNYHRVQENQATATE